PDVLCAAKIRNPPMSSAPATVTSNEALWAARLLQTGDSYYPTGAYSHSFGLEGLVETGVVRDIATLRNYFFGALLPALERIELPLTAHLQRALAASDWAEVG